MQALYFIFFSHLNCRKLWVDLYSERERKVDKLSYISHGWWRELNVIYLGILSQSQFALQFYRLIFFCSFSIYLIQPSSRFITDVTIELDYGSFFFVYGGRFEINNTFVWRVLIGCMVKGVENF
jgi:hypothetical protein